MVTLIFETEVEGYLQRLESILAESKPSCLFEELSWRRLGGLGEMLEISAFKSLCSQLLSTWSHS